MRSCRGVIPGHTIGRAGESCRTCREAAALCSTDDHSNSPGDGKNQEGVRGDDTCSQNGINLPSVDQIYDAFQAAAILPGGVGGPPQAVEGANDFNLQDNQKQRDSAPTTPTQHDAKGQFRGAPSELRSGSGDSHDHEMCTVKPMFHVMPPSGWGSDPNGPIFWKGRYHLFFQARPHTCQWYWGMRWDHVASYDMARWERLPPAIVPTPGGTDADGCFSGSIQPDPRTGVPVCFYTGARRRANREVQLPAPPQDQDMGLGHFESQCCAVCDPDDELLEVWHKVPAPLMEHPHTGQVNAWRDPWFVERGGPREGEEWTMLIGSGVKGAGGIVLVYRSADFTKGWRYVGDLCSARDSHMGVVWECPFLVQLQPLPLCAHVLPTADLAAHGAAAMGPGLAAVHIPAASADLSPIAATAPTATATTAAAAAIAAATPSTPFLGVKADHSQHASATNPATTTVVSAAYVPAAAAAAIAAAENVQLTAGPPAEPVPPCHVPVTVTVPLAAVPGSVDLPRLLSQQPSASSAASCNSNSIAAAMGDTAARRAAADALTQILAVAAAAPPQSAMGEGSCSSRHGDVCLGHDRVEAAGTAAGGSDTARTLLLYHGACDEEEGSARWLGHAVSDAECTLSCSPDTVRTYGTACGTGTFAARGMGGTAAGFSLALSDLSAGGAGLASRAAKGLSGALAGGWGKKGSGDMADGGSGTEGDAGGDGCSSTAPPEATAAAAEAAIAAPSIAAAPLFGEGPHSTADPGPTPVCDAADAGSGASHTAPPPPPPPSPGRSPRRKEVRFSTPPAAAGLACAAAAASVVPGAEERPSTALTSCAAVSSGAAHSQDDSHTTSTKIYPAAHLNTAGAARLATSSSCSALASPATAAPLAASARTGASASMRDLHAMVGEVMAMSEQKRQQRLKQQQQQQQQGSGSTMPTPAAARKPLPRAISLSHLSPPQRPTEQLHAPVNMRYHKAQQPVLVVSTASNTALAQQETPTTMHTDMECQATHGHAVSIPPEGRWMFGCAPDACHISTGLVGTRVTYWLGRYDSCTAKYDMDVDGGGAALDMGNTLYAPAVFTDPQGRHVLWAFMKELVTVPPAPALCTKYPYYGCLSLPRALHLKGDRLFQLPLPELTALRTDVAFHLAGGAGGGGGGGGGGGEGGGGVSLRPGAPWRLRGVDGAHLDVELEISPGTARRTAVLFGSWRPGGRGAGALVYEWATRRLWVVFDAMRGGRRAEWAGEDAAEEEAAAAAADGTGAQGVCYRGAAPEPPPAGVQQQQQQQQQQQHEQGQEDQQQTQKPQCGADSGVRLERSGSNISNGGSSGPGSDVAAPTQRFRWGGAADGAGPHGARRGQEQQRQPQRPPCAPVGVRISVDVQPCDGTTANEPGGRADTGGAQMQADRIGRANQVDSAEQAQRAEGAEGAEGAESAERVVPPGMRPDHVADWLWMRREEAGGVLAVAPGSPLRLRIFVDGSALEVFTDSGQALTTRLYRGMPPQCHGHDGEGSPAADPGIELHAVGGHCTLAQLHAYQVAPGWAREGDMPEEENVQQAAG